MRTQNYNPDVLTCLANLSNDEVFTPPAVVNKMLDMLPAELWSNPDARFLDPVSKTGVFLREIAKRLMEGLKEQMPDLQQRADHIFGKQLYGLAITELTALMSRRSVYCSKYANGRYSVCTAFDDEQGNIRYESTAHTWQNGRCVYCGASQEVYDRGGELESHAYRFIHTDNPKKLYPNMKFDVIIGNPPYQLSDGGGLQTESSSGSAIPLYQKFIQQAKKLQPRYLIMIVPARWFSGGRGLNEFRDEMLSDKRLTTLVDYVDSRDCFPGVDIAGGVCYFLWDKTKTTKKCMVTSIYNNSEYSSERDLSEFPVFVRHSISCDIIRKTKSLNEKPMSDMVYSSKPFGFRSFESGTNTPFKDAISLFGSKGVSYVKYEDVRTNSSFVAKWKVIMSKTSAEHAGQADKDGKKRIVSRIEILPPNSICSESYLLLGVFDSESEAISLKNYVKTKFFRFLLSTILLTQNIAKDKFVFIPQQDFNCEWTDEKLYAKYGLTDDEINFIESMIRPME